MNGKVTVDIERQGMLKLPWHILMYDPGILMERMRSCSNKSEFPVEIRYACKKEGPKCTATRLVHGRVA
jgi:hypothetical protein